MKRFWTVLTLTIFCIMAAGATNIFAVEIVVPSAQEEAGASRTAPPPPPAIVSIHNEKGIALYNRGAFGAAIIEFSKQLEYNPDDVTALINRGISYARRGEYKIAIENLFTALSIKSDNVLIMKYIAAVYYLDREYSKALDIYEKAITRANNDYEAIASKGCALIKLGRNAEAATEFTRSLYLMPDDVVSFIGRGISLSNTGKYRGAVADLNKAASLVPDDPFIYLVRAEANAGAVAFTSAIADLKKACSLSYGAVCAAMKQSKAELAEAAGTFILQYSTKGPDEELYDKSRKKLDRFYTTKYSSEIRKYFISQLKPLTK